jgi:hypothetical protein
LHHRHQLTAGEPLRLSPDVWLQPSGKGTGLRPRPGEPPNKLLKSFLLTTKLPLGENLGMSRLLQALPLTLALAAFSFFAASCGSSSTPAQVRFVNAIQDTAQYGAGLDIEVNGTNDFTDIPFQGVQPSSGYTKVPSGAGSIEGVETGTATTIFRSNSSLSAGTQYTIVATGFATNSSKVALISAADENAAPASGNVEFRVINASPSGPNGIPGAVDIYMVPVGSNAGLTSATLIVSNLAYRSASNYVTLPYNPNFEQGFNYTMFVTAAGIPTPILITENLSASAGAIRTLVLTDQQNVDQLNPLAIVLNDLN